MSNTIYNLLHFGGYWSAYNGNTRVETPYSVGEFPLLTTNDRTISGDVFSRSNDPSIRLVTSEFFDIAKSGDVLKITFLLPNVSNSWGSGAYKGYSLSLQNADSKKQVQCGYNPENNSMSLVTSSDGVFGLGAFTSLMSDSVITPIVMGGKTVGFTLEGKLLDAIKRITLMPTFEHEKSATTLKGTVSYSSYDDLQIEVNPIPESTDYSRHKPLPFMEGLRIGQYVRGMRK